MGGESLSAVSDDGTFNYNDAVRIKRKSCDNDGLQEHDIVYGEFHKDSCSSLGGVSHSSVSNENVRNAGRISHLVQEEGDDYLLSSRRRRYAF